MNDEKEIAGKIPVAKITRPDPVEQVYLDQIRELVKAHRDLVILTAYMAEHDYSPKDIAYAVEKPYKFGDVLANAQADLETEMAPTLRRADEYKGLHSVEDAE